jgi:DNA polymerase
MDPFTDSLIIDVETCSLADLKRVGGWIYSRHPSTRVYCLSMGLANAETVTTVIPDRIIDTVNGGAQEREWTLKLHEFVKAGGALVAHNVAFERAIWENILVPRHNYPPVAPEQWVCTQAMGRAMNLPASLEGLAKALGTKIQKDTESAAVMRKMAAAVDQRHGMFSFSPSTVTADNMTRLIAYCEQDVQATRLVYRKLRRIALSLHEEQVWRADQEINARGAYLDRNFARRCQVLAQERKQQLDDDVFALTDGDLTSASEPRAMKRWLRSHDVVLPKLVRAGGKRTETLNAQAVQGLLDADPSPIARAVLERRQEAARATSLAKLSRVSSMTDTDGRIRFVLASHATITGRWASYGMQLHNLPKVHLSLVDLALARSIVDRGDLELLEMLFDQPLAVLSQLLRSIVAAPPGYELIAADYAAIEARIVAWLAGQDDIVELFRAGEDVYTHAAHKIGSDDRQLGKTCTLALGFGMGDLKFAATAAKWNVPLDLATARRIKIAWREQNPQIVAFWHDLEQAAHRAVSSPGRIFIVGRIKVQCTANRQCLMVVLPSGRALRYWRPSLVTARKKIQTATDDGEIIEIEVESVELRFFTPSKNARLMVQDSTYGGKLVENVTQATARELLACALVGIRKHGWPYATSIHVHDSLAAEVPVGHGDVEELCWIMCQTPPWADGLPVAAEGYRDTRFRG